MYATHFATLPETIVTGLYYNHPKKSLAKGICLIQRDDDVEFVRIRNANKGRISLYLGQNNEDLSKYVDGEIDDEKEQYGSHDNDTDSDVASLDHLSQSEEELRQVRLNKANQKTKENSLNNYDFNMLVEVTMKMRVSRIVIQHFLKSMKIVKRNQ
ncbi:hypothetical protein Tco_0718893, partial [Tanacetum coccineum]